MTKSVIRFLSKFIDWDISFCILTVMPKKSALSAKKHPLLRFVFQIVPFTQYAMHRTNDFCIAYNNIRNPYLRFPLNPLTESR